MVSRPNQLTLSGSRQPQDERLITTKKNTKKQKNVWEKNNNKKRKNKNKNEMHLEI